MRKGSYVSLLFVICVAAMAQQTGEQERNKQIARGFFEEVLDQGHLDRYAQSHSQDFVAHGGDRDATLEEDMAEAKDERKAFPDGRMRVNQIIAERDLVVVHWTASGTNTQAGMGFPATGKTIKVSGMTLFRFKGGKICEEWNAWDELSFLRQLGLAPPAQ
jgi:steroid delta-isomerase-like uncharacterized protein